MNDVLSSADQVSLTMVYNEIIKVRGKLESVRWDEIKKIYKK